MPTRRHLLAAAGVAVATPGCMSVLGNEGDDADPEAAADASEAEETDADADGEAESEANTVVLEELSVQNNHEEAHEVQLAVEDRGEVLHLGTYDLEAEGATTLVEGDWSSDEGAYRIHARLDDGEIQSTAVTEGVPEDSGCVRVLVRVDDEGTLGIWNGADCA